MGVDYTASALWGVEVQPPEDCEDAYVWAEGLILGTPFSLFSSGSSYYGDKCYAIGIGASSTSRGGADWKGFKGPTWGQQRDLRKFLVDKDLPGVPGFMLGLHVW